MRTRCCNAVRVLLVAMTLLLLPSTICKAKEVYTNPESGYAVVVEDECNLLSDYEKQQMIEVMEEISAYGNVAFVSALGGEKSRHTESLAKVRYLEYFDNTAGTIFFIDMKSRYLYIYSHEEMYDVITSNYANTITDNVYRSATNGAYGECAISAFSQILSLLQGQSISQPMKYISNTLLGLALGLLLTFLWLLRWYGRHAAEREDKLKMVMTDVKFIGTYVMDDKTTETYYPQGNRTAGSSSSSGFGGFDSGSSFGGGDFGGGDSGDGGGGGHSF